MTTNNEDILAAPERGSALTGDDAMMDQVNQALRTNTATARAPIDVAAQGATVTLSGTVGSQDVKRAAEQIARGVPGVVDVTNDVVIGDNAGGGVFGLFGNHDNDAATGADNNGGALPLIGRLLGSDANSSARGETRQSRNADAEEEDLS